MATATKPRLIDCDIHNAPPTFDELLPFLPVHWQELMRQSDFKGPAPDLYPAGLPLGGQPETRPNGDGAAGSDVKLLAKQLLDRLEIELGILNCTYALEALHNPYGVAALAAAVNDWQRSAWLEQEPRLRASIIVPAHEPELAAEEVARSGAYPAFVQVTLPVRSRELYGTRRYHPLYRAAAAHKLVVAIHAGGAPGAPPTSSGWPSYYAEEYAGMAQLFQSQLTSLILEGVLEEFPDLTIVLAASGFTWLPAYMWRLDKEWKGLRREIPWVKQPPSEYIRQRVRFTLQPLDAPPSTAQLEQVLEQAGSDELLLFSTDYPYNCYQSVDEALPAALPAGLREKILFENAAEVYAERPTR